MHVCVFSVCMSEGLSSTPKALQDPEALPMCLDSVLLPCEQSSWPGSTQLSPTKAPSLTPESVYLLHCVCACMCVCLCARTRACMYVQAQISADNFLGDGFLCLPRESQGSQSGHRVQQQAL